MCRSSFTCKEITKRVLALTLFIFLSWTIAGAYRVDRNNVSQYLQVVTLTLA